MIVQRGRTGSPALAAAAVEIRRVGAGPAPDDGQGLTAQFGIAAPAGMMLHPCADVIEHEARQVDQAGLDVLAGVEFVTVAAAAQPAAGCARCILVEQLGQAARVRVVVRIEDEVVGVVGVALFDRAADVLGIRDRAAAHGLEFVTLGIDADERVVAQLWLTVEVAQQEPPPVLALRARRDRRLPHAGFNFVIG
jgi:hypothetical protein